MTVRKRKVDTTRTNAKDNTMRTSTTLRASNLRRALFFDAAVCVLYAVFYLAAPFSDRVGEYARELEAGWGFGVVPAESTGTPFI